MHVGMLTLMAGHAGRTTANTAAYTFTFTNHGIWTSSMIHSETYAHACLCSVILTGIYVYAPKDGMPLP